MLITINFVLNILQLAGGKKIWPTLLPEVPEQRQDRDHMRADMVTLDQIFEEAKGRWKGQRGQMEREVWRSCTFKKRKRTGKQTEKNLRKNEILYFFVK